MILPDDEECSRILLELLNDPGLTEWQAEFVESNYGRTRFTDKQREVVAELQEKFEV